MNQIANKPNDGGTHILDHSSLIRDHSCNDFRLINRAAHISALGIILRNFPLDVFNQEERVWFLEIQSKICRMESSAFDDIGME